MIERLGMRNFFRIFIVGYAFSPIDLIPDFIPFFGYLDDAIIIPIGIVTAIKLISKNVLNDPRIIAQEWLENKKDNPQNIFVVILIFSFWILLILIILLEDYINTYLNFDFL